MKTGDLKPNVQDFFDQSEDGCEARAWFEERLKTELSDIEEESLKTNKSVEVKLQKNDRLQITKLDETTYTVERLPDTSS